MAFSKSFTHSKALFDAAVIEFSAAGYEQASINRILKEAGMSKGQFYYHFPNKKELYFALIEIIISRKKNFLAGVSDRQGFEGDIFSSLRSQIKNGLAFAAAEPQIEAFANAFLREQGQAIFEEALQRFNFQNDAALNEQIARAYGRGELRDDLPLPLVQRLIGFLFSHVSELTELSSTHNAAENLDHLLDFMKHGLAPRE